MKGIKVRTYIENGSEAYRWASDAIITGGICFAIPFEWEVNLFEDSYGTWRQDYKIELVNAHFYGGEVLTIPMADYKKAVDVCDADFY